MLDWLQTSPAPRGRNAGRRPARRNRRLAGPRAGWLTAAGRSRTSDRQGRGLGAGLLLLICGDVIRPGLRWLLARSGLQLLTAEMARTRDPAGFAGCGSCCEAGQVSPLTRDLSLRRIAAIMAAKGGAVSDITAGDCLELAAVAVRAIDGPRSKDVLLPAAARGRRAPAGAPASVRMFATRGPAQPRPS